MPAHVERDAQETARTIATWMAKRFPEHGDIEVTNLSAPPSSGFSGETILLDATWGGEVHPLVVRVAPTTYTVFLDPDFEAQFKVMEALDQRTDVPMPEMLGFEADPSLLGAPFSLMRRVPGEAAPDAPAYTESGWVKDATPEQQARMYESGLRAMAAVHTLDWRALGLDFLRRDEVEYAERYHAWAVEELGGTVPIVEEAWAWLRANVPAKGELALCWGDARPGNLLFDDFEVAAVLDWEMVAIDDPLLDLGWWLFLQRFHTEGYGFPLLPGFLDEEAAIRRWEELTGRSVDREALRFYLVFAGIRFGIVMMRLATLFQRAGMLPDAMAMAANNPVLSVLESELRR